MFTILKNLNPCVNFHIENVKSNNSIRETEDKDVVSDNTSECRILQGMYWK